MPTRRPWDDAWKQYPVSKPKRPEQGIATRKQRGDMASTWWSARRVMLLDSYGLGARIRTPIGPFRFDLAYGQESRQVRLQFSVGVSF